jgi:pimeloyl-ACP methyl ester carboxylesterase
MQEPGRLRAALDWYRAAARSPRRASLAGPVTVPTTYVWGARDPALGRRAAELTSERVSGPYRFVELATATHWLPEQHLDEVWSHVVDRQVA